MSVDRGMVEAALGALRCQDDSLSPDSWLLCTEPDLHEGPHIARGTAGILETWPRGKGRAAGHLRREWGIK